MDAEQRNSRGWLHLGDGIYERDGIFEARFRLDRRKVSKQFPTRKAAEQFKTDTLQEYRRGSYIPESKELFAERCDGWLKRMKDTPGYRFSTLQNYQIHIEKYLKPSLGALRTQRLSVKLCEEAAIDWAALTSANTANKALQTCTMILSEAQRHGVIAVNPAEKAKRIKISTEDDENGEIQPEDIYTGEQLAALIEATDPGTLGRILIWLGGFCGLRIGEILAFSWPAIGNLKTASKLRVFKNLVPEKKEKADFPGYGETGRTLKDPKKKSRRTLDVPRELISDLRLWKLQCPLSQPREGEGVDPLAHQLVMVTVEGKPLQTRAAQALLDEATEHANRKMRERQGRELTDEEGIPRRTLHRLRHTFASLLLMDGVPLQRVSAMLGHRDIGITARTYAHFIESESNAIRDLAARVMEKGKDHLK